MNYQFLSSLRREWDQVLNYQFLPSLRREWDQFKKLRLEECFQGFPVRYQNQPGSWLNRARWFGNDDYFGCESPPAGLFIEASAEALPE